jgi:hypothetical protein
MRVLLVGDIHGNVAWLQRRVFPAAIDQSVDVIVQVGDFGWWPRVRTSDAFIEIARASPLPLWWIDGNHEDHDRLATAVEASGGAGEDGLVDLAGSLSFIPRGTRFEWDGVGVLACGGAHSIDRRMRIAGVSWFEAEHVTDDDVVRCIAGGHADILLSHDAPAGWRIPNLPSDRRLPPSWQVELPACESHRGQLGRILDAVAPSLVVHGHYHSAYQQTLDTGWGTTDVLGLSEDGTADNLAVLECSRGSWTVEPVTLW